MLINRNAEGVHTWPEKACPKPEPGQQRQTINESVCWFDWFL